jgi:prepilin-type N-terminal cleavage/methylation domain-containing protein/prepilin-type processing-associated H-X9-DG protein
MTDGNIVASRRRGFTVGELLIALAIVAILSALLFPVFTQARAVARGGMCLANVQTITRAFRMYLADNHGFLPPSETREEVKDFFDAIPGPGGWLPCPESVVNGANPYLRYPVILDEYIPYRRSWQCPQARLQTGPRVIIPGPDWFGVLLANRGKIGPDFCIRDSVFPPGWGGDITDSFAQNRVAYVSFIDRVWGDLRGSVRRPFTQSIGVNGVRDLALASVPDPSSFIIVGDAGPQSEQMSPGLLAYPDICNLECANCWCSDAWIEDCIDSIEQGCPAIAQCFHSYHANSSLLSSQTISARYTRSSYVTYRDPSVLSYYARHVRGTNIGFLDGHVEWVDSARFLDEWAREARLHEGWPSAMGIEAWGPYSWYDCGSGPFSQRSGGQPTLR